MLTVVAHTDHDGGYLFECRVTEHGDLVLRLVVGVIIDDVRDGVAHAFISGPFGFVTGYLRVRECAEREVEHVFCRPDGLAVNGGVVVIHARCCQVQRYLVFVVVVPQVGTETDETAQVSVFQFRINGT